MATVAERIRILRDFPQQLEQMTAHLTSAQLTTAYNAPEWTIAQNIHHVADSHMNAFLRFKWAVTEDNPTIKTYHQDNWASQPDANNPDIVHSLAILHGLHARWVVLLESITDWSRPLMHPDKGQITLDDLLTTYANHCGAHIKQIADVLEKMPQA